MKKFKKILLSCILATLVVNLAGCTKENKEDTVKESVEETVKTEEIIEETVSTGEEILENLNNKYLLTMPQDLQESMVLGYLYYFNNDQVKVQYLPIYESEDLTYKYVGKDIGKDFLTFKLVSTFNGEEHNHTLKITKNEGETFKYKWDEGEEKELELLDKEECEKTLKENYKFLQLSNARDEFYNNFDLYMNKLSSISTSQDNTSQVKNYANKEDAIKRVKEIIDPVGITLDGTDNLTITTYEGTQAWEFYIVSGGSAVHFLYLDINSGEFKESINPSCDWRYTWHDV